MTNIKCSPSSDNNMGKIERTRTINLFGNQFEIKNYNCAKNGGEYRLKPEIPKLQVSILPTGFCNAKCPFCISEKTNNDRNFISLQALERTLHELNKTQIVRGISITGGEPFTDIVLLDETINMIFEILGDDTELSLNTNGKRIKDILNLKSLMKLDQVHISRHHYDERINNEIFGIDMPTNQELKEALDAVSYCNLFVFNCMLLKDYISTPEDVYKYLDFAIETGAGKASFITVSPVNQFALKQRIDYQDVIRKDDPHFLFTKNYTDFEWCRCDDAIYCSDEGKTIELYGRTTNTDTCNYCRGFSFNSDNKLRIGYTGDVIFDAGRIGHDD